MLLYLYLINIKYKLSVMVKVQFTRIILILREADYGLAWTIFLNSLGNLAS